MVELPPHVGERSVCSTSYEVLFASFGVVQHLSKTPPGDGYTKGWLAGHAATQQSLALQPVQMALPVACAPSRQVVVNSLHLLGGGVVS